LSKEIKIDDTISYDGCHGHRGSYGELGEFLDDFIETSLEDEEFAPDERWVACIWGVCGIGKSNYVKQFANKPVAWNGKEYDGWDIRNIPIAQLEEMGDIHGLPEKHVFMEKGVTSKWVSCEGDILNSYKEDGWEVDHTKGVKTMYAKPDFVPDNDGPAIILIDDFNRAGRRIIQGLMQLFQTHKTVSWNLPKGCVIVLTGNPSMHDYIVNDIDMATKTRMCHFTLIPDHKQWVSWATKNKLDSRGISYVARYPEMMIGKECTNPRSLTKFFRFLRRIEDIDKESKRVIRFAKGLLDEETVSSMFGFFRRDLDLVLEPEEILAGGKAVQDHLMKLSKGEKNKTTGETDIRMDIITVMAERLYAYICHNMEELDKAENLFEFLLSPHLQDDLRYNIMARIASNNKTCIWLVKGRADQVAKATEIIQSLQ
jgi:hypothetical protein